MLFYIYVSTCLVLLVLVFISLLTDSSRKELAYEIDTPVRKKTTETVVEMKFSSIDKKEFFIQIAGKLRKVSVTDAIFGKIAKGQKIKISYKQGVFSKKFYLVELLSY